MKEPNIKIEKFKFLVVRTGYTSRLTKLDKYFMQNHCYSYDYFDEEEPEREPMPMIVAIRDKLWGSDKADGGIKIYDKDKLNEFEEIIGIPKDSFQDCEELDGTIIFASTKKDGSLYFYNLDHILDMIGTEGIHSFCANLTSEYLVEIKSYGECNEVVLVNYGTES